ncbi:MAG: Flp pilus assembly complex ATPase component TadA, partial [Caulobacteraceae bacterium]|nr:Flp pilus assembly complex ATPase component TadA [Caulobacteraceae bacterium]
MSVILPGPTTRQPPASLEQLVEGAGLLTPDTLARARFVGLETGERLASIITRLGFLSEQALATALSRATGLAVADEADYAADPPTSFEAVSARYLRTVKAAPLRETVRGVEVAFADPLDRAPLQALSLASGRTIIAAIGRVSDIEGALDRLYGAAGGSAADADEIDDADLERLADLASDAPAIRAVNRLITAAVEARASDIHLEPTEASLQVRFRIDGALEDQASLPGAMKAAAISRIKVMAGLNIAERR